MDYSKLLEKAKVAYDNAATGAERRRLESIFPELAEDRDESIKNEIIDFVKGNRDFANKKIVDKWIVWLESLNTQKQEYGEQDKVNFEIIHDEIFNRMQQFSIGCKKRQEIESAFIWFCNMFKLQSKNNWCEEDKNRFTILSGLITDCNCWTKQDKEDYVNWLKKLTMLKQKHWKPTEEQIEALGEVCKGYYSTHVLCKGNNAYEKSISLYNELKKL